MVNDASGLHVETVGAGAPLVMLHGWALHGGVFSPLLPSLARHHRVHVVDLPGHGHSGSLTTWTLDAVVDAIDAALGTGPEPLDVFGWSLGGAIALHWAMLRPARVRRLVLVASTPKFVASADWPHAMDGQSLTRFADELSVAYRATFFRFLSLQVLGSDDARATLAMLRREAGARREPDADTLAQSLQALAQLDLRDEVPRIATRSLVVGGGRDTLVPPQACRWLASSLVDARLEMFEGAGHAPFLSHREPFLDTVNEFLADG